MNNLKNPTSVGWMVQVYGQNRKLICILEASHGWTFLMGFILGIGISLMAAVVVHPNAHSLGPSIESSTPSGIDFPAPLMLD